MREFSSKEIQKAAEEVQKSGNGDFMFNDPGKKRRTHHKRTSRRKGPKLRRTSRKHTSGHRIPKPRHTSRRHTSRKNTSRSQNTSRRNTSRSQNICSRNNIRRCCHKSKLMPSNRFYGEKTPSCNYRTKEYWENGNMWKLQVKRT